MAGPDKREMIRRLYEEIINRANYRHLNSIFSENVVWHDPLLPGGAVRALKHFKDVLRMF